MNKKVSLPTKIPGNVIHFLELIFIAGPVTAFLGYVFFYRGFELGFFSFSTFYPILLAYLLFIFGVIHFKRQLFRKLTPTVGNLAPVIFFFLIYFPLHLLWNPEESYILSRFAFEVFGNLGSILVGYWVVKRYGLDFFCQSLLWAALIIGVIIFNKLSSLDTIRRIGSAASGESASLAVAVNHLGHALAFTAVCGLNQIHKLYQKNKYTYSFALGVAVVLLVFMTFLTGSRAAVLGLLISIIIGFLLLGVGKKRIFKRSTNIKIAVISVTVFLSVLAIYEEKLRGLLDRFETEMIVRGIQNRWVAFEQAVETATEWAIVFGNPWKYAPLQNIDAISYPHNWFLSISLHLGIIVTILFTVYLYIITKTVINSPKTSRIDKWMLLSCIAIVIIYVLTSGRLTRVITIFVLFGVCWASSSIYSKNFWSLKSLHESTIK